jgi:hypothetical protein
VDGYVADIINEIDEELRKDKAQEWWRKNGKIAVALCTAIIVAVAGYSWYESYRKSQLQEWAERYGAVQALASEDTVGASEALAQLAQETVGEGISLVSRFQSAGILAQGRDHAGAAGAFEKIAADSSVPALYQELAKLKRIIHAEIAGEDPVQLVKDITPLTADEAPWRFTARMVAVSLAIRTDDMEAARKYIKQVSDAPDAPSSARGQAAEILQALEN